MSMFSQEPLMPITFIVVPTVIGEASLPYRRLRNQHLPTAISTRLADPAFDLPAPVQALLGVGAWARLMQENIIPLMSGLMAQQTRLGWLIFGDGAAVGGVFAAVAKIDQDHGETDHNLDKQLRDFFESEGLPGDKSHWTEEEQLCEAHFLSTHQVDPTTGRYVLQIPLRGVWSRIGSNRAIALQRFLRLEQRLERDSGLREKYYTFINEYLDNDWMRPVTREARGPVYYIPHHAVLKKFRVVFDASCTTDSGLSLNDVQMIGPKLQRNLIDLLWGFRLPAYGVSADIRQMFPQVKIAPEHWDLQRIVWRDERGHIAEYWLTGVTFGMASAPYCAVRAMQQCAKDNKDKWPLGSRAILQYFYMDDCLAGADSEEELEQLCREMQQLLSAGGFELTKWRSNSKTVQTVLSPISHKHQALLNASVDASVLGLRWDPSADELTFRLQSLPVVPVSGWTKRSILGVTARLYDPNGLAAPFIIRAKVLLQGIWKAKIGWDVPLPVALISDWQSIFSQLTQFELLRIPRWLGVGRERSLMLHGFADASTQAFGAAIYMVARCGNNTISNLLLAKSRVAPLKTETIPRLELRAATLLSSLMQRVIIECETEHQVKIFSATCWSDSMVVLCWLKRETGTLKQFVANRVRQIQEKTLSSEWRHVPTEINPADLITRGMNMNEMLSSRLWWHGPAFIQDESGNWPCVPENVSARMDAEVKEECRRLVNSNEQATSQEVVIAAGASRLPRRKSFRVQLVASINAVSIDQQSLLFRYCSLDRLLRITSWVRRFLHNCRTPVEGQQKQPLSVLEMEESLTHWIKQEQYDHFKADIRELQNRRNNGRQGDHQRLSNAVAGLAPFIHDDILRMRGRLQNADISGDQRNPIILPGKGRLAWLLARSTHLKMLHCGAQQLIAVLRQRSWIVGVRALARTLIKDCIVCERARARLGEQIMGDLPSCRVRSARPFLHTGVDYAGPILVRPDRRRGKTVLKGYIAVFICMVSKAVHLEFVSDLTTNAFIMAFVRFTSRYGHCSHLWSDNGTNFVGAERELSRMLETWGTSDLYDKLAERRTQWHFITPSAPHQGGLWEAAVKAAKHHLRRVMGARLLTVEVVQTLVAEISAILNSRPLCAQSADPADFSFLTPGHLLIGEPIVPVLGEQVPMKWPENRLNYWQTRQKAVQTFWKLWSQSYLHELQQRPKWRQVRRNIKQGDLVVIKNESTPPTLWKMARVSALHPGPDGLVRNVTLWTGHNTISRPIQRLCVLPVEPVEPRSESGLKAGGC